MAEPLNATFFAFRKREKGGVLWGVSIAYVVVAIALGAAFAALNWQGISDYFTWSMSLSQHTGEVDPNDMSSIMPPASVMAIFPMYLLFMLIYYLLFAAYEAACLRWMIHGESSGLFGLALNADTLRVYFTYWLWFFLLVAFYLIVVVVGVGFGVGIGVVASGSSADQLGAMGLAAFGVGLLVLLLVIYVCVRLAPAAATSIARRRFSFFDAWKVTKGRFWALLGSYALLFLMLVVGSMIVAFGASMIMGTALIGQMQSGAEPSSPQEMFALIAAPGVWIPLAVMYAAMIIGTFVLYIALFGVSARAAQAALQEGKIAAAS